MALSLTTAVRSARATALNTSIGNAALVRIYAGTPPADANTALSSNTLLGTLTGGSPFGTVTDGVLTAGAITQDSAADATGTATFGRVLASDGTTVIMQFSVGTSGTDLILNSTSIQSGGPIAVSSFVITEA